MDCRAERRSLSGYMMIVLTFFFLRKLISKWGRCRKQLDVGFQRIGTVVHLWPRWRWKKQEVLWTGEPSLVMMASRMGVAMAGWRRLHCILCLVLYFSIWFFKCGEPIYIKIAIYCPQGSGTLRHQSLMMH